jgi:hypothetical protein
MECCARPATIAMRAGVRQPSARPLDDSDGEDDATFSPVFS